MSGTYDGEALAVAFRMAVQFAAAEGVTKAAGTGYSHCVAAHVDAWMPFALTVAASTERLDKSLRILQCMYEADQARKQAQAQAFSMSVRGAEEPHQMVPLDPEQMKLRATLGPHPGPAYVNGHSNGHDLPGGGI